MNCNWTLTTGATCRASCPRLPTNIRGISLPDMTVMLAGKVAFGEFYASHRFVHDGLRAELLTRIVAGNTVVDHELIHGLGPEPFETTVMFIVENGLISTVFSIPAKSQL